MRKATALGMIFLLAACGEKDGDSASSDILPTEGPWGYENFTFDSDECNYESFFPVGTIEAIELTLALTADGYSMSSTLTDNPIECTMVGADYSCELSATDDVVEWPKGSKNTGDPDAVNTTVTSVSGSFIDEISATFAASLTNDCEGADCETLAAEVGATVPCTTSVSSDLVYIGG